MELMKMSCTVPQHIAELSIRKLRIDVEITTNLLKFRKATSKAREYLL